MDESSRGKSPRWGQHLAGAASGIGGAAPAPSQCGTAGWIPGAAGAANPAAGARHVWRGGGAGERGGKDRLHDLLRGSGRGRALPGHGPAAPDGALPAPAAFLGGELDNHRSRPARGRGRRDRKRKRKINKKWCGPTRVQAQLRHRSPAAPELEQRRPPAPPPRGRSVTQSAVSCVCPPFPRPAQWRSLTAPSSSSPPLQFPLRPPGAAAAPGAPTQSGSERGAGATGPERDRGRAGRHRRPRTPATPPRPRGQRTPTGRGPAWRGAAARR